MTLPDIDALRERLIGHPFPGGSFEVAEYERWLSHDAMLSPAIPAPTLHPVWILLGALRGMGLSIEELTELAEVREGDGTVFGETVMEQTVPLRAGVHYTVSGGISDIVRRTGRSGGTMDMMTFRLDLTDPEGTVAAVSEQTFIFLRRSA